MYCGSCGAPIVEGASFCGKCGAPVSQAIELVETPAAEPPPPPQPPTAPAEVHAPVNTNQTNGLAIASLVLGIVGVFFGLLSILAIIFGGVAIGQIDRAPGSKGKGLAIAGLVLGIVVVAFWIIFMVLMVVSFRRFSL